MRGGGRLYGYVKKPTQWLDEFGLQGRLCGETAHGNHYMGEDKPARTGEPNSVYTHIDENGKAKQNAIYDAQGDVIGHVDFETHGGTSSPAEPSGHWHEFPIPGNPGSDHGKGKSHNSPDTVPDGWVDLPKGIEPREAIGTINFKGKPNKKNKL